VTKLTGWGHTAPSRATVVEPRSEAEALTHLSTASAVVARGLGRSYGDAAQVAGGVVISDRGFDAIALDTRTGVVTAGAGVSIDELLAVSMPAGWFVPVTPGTRQVTLGGAVAADVHGKNHHRDGGFGDHVTALRVVTPVGVRALTPDDPLFWATVGGMGLTGVITQVTLQLLAITSDRVTVDTDRYGNLNDVMAAMIEGDSQYRYSVAWLDCMGPGRSILTRADHAPGDGAIVPPKTARLGVPFAVPGGLLNALSVRAFNELWFRRAPRHRRAQSVSISTFFHPLDGVRDWNRLYGPRGFVHYQFVVPDERGDVVHAAIEVLRAARVPSFFGVLKRFGPQGRGLLSFPLQGWTLALDVAVGPSTLPGALEELDQLVASAGGRIYLAKDSRLAPEHLSAMYPNLDEFRSLQHSIDPERRLRSDLARRLSLLD